MTSAERPETIYLSITSAKQKQQKSGTGSEADGFRRSMRLTLVELLLRGFRISIRAFRGGEAKPGTKKSTKQDTKNNEIEFRFAKRSHVPS